MCVCVCVCVCVCMCACVCVCVCVPEWRWRLFTQRFGAVVELFRFEFCSAVQGVVIWG